MICFLSVANSKQQLFIDKNKGQTQSDSRLLTTVIHWLLSYFARQRSRLLENDRQIQSPITVWWALKVSTDNKNFHNHRFILEDLNRVTGGC